MLSSSSQEQCVFERPERFVRIEVLLHQPGGVTMTGLMENLKERRTIISEDLEMMRDEMGLPVRWNSETGAFFLGKENEESLRDGSMLETTHLSLLFQALEHEERIYVITAAGTGEEERIYGLPKELQTELDRCFVVLLTESGDLRRIDLESVRNVNEAFGSRR